ncbi:MAG: hypothetical protein R3F29_01555 [Planctomycetota bacterium]
MHQAYSARSTCLRRRTSSELTLHAPGHEGALYLAGCALGITTGIPTPYGRIAINDDDLLRGTLGYTSVALSGMIGLVPSTGEAPASVAIPNQPRLVGMAFYVNFVTFPAGGPWGLAAPGKVTID